MPRRAVILEQNILAALEEETQAKLQSAWTLHFINHFTTGNSNQWSQNKGRKAEGSNET